MVAGILEHADFVFNLYHYDGAVGVGLGDVAQERAESVGIGFTDCRRKGRGNLKGLTAARDGARIGSGVALEPRGGVA